MRTEPATPTARALVALALLLTVAFAPSAAMAACGDGLFDDNEQCDPGPDLPGDCCDVECRYVGAEVPCTDDGLVCTIDACDGEGTCAHLNTLGTCDDGNPCTLGDFCSRAAQCIPQGLQENGIECPNEGLCGNFGTCQEGACLGDPADCDGVGFACQVATCDPDKRACQVTQAEDGTICGSKTVCVGGGKCDTGECIPQPTDCSAFTDDCNVGLCDVEAPGGCYASPRQDGTACEDGNGCSVDDSCRAGLCESGAPRDCSQLDDACHVGICNGDLGQCQADLRENGSECDDGNACTTGDQCTAGACAGTPVDCSDFDGACVVGRCDPQVGQCVSVPAGDGTLCDDQAFCTLLDQCIGGACNGTGNPCFGGGECANTCDEGSDSCLAAAGKPCSSDENPCTDDTCDGDGGCVHTANTEACDDGKGCTSGDTCTAGACAGTPVDCSDFDGACVVGRCDPQVGQCVSVPAGDGALCDDQAFCTLLDQCIGGACNGTGNPCFGGGECANTCDEGSDSCLAAAGKPCSSDENPCTDDTCDGDGGCEHTANTEACDDGLFCTSSDTCVDGECAGEPTCPRTEGCGDTCNEDEDACRTCGHPFSEERCVVNAIFVLQAAIDLRDCELCTCDVDDNGSINTSDALRILRTCVNLTVTLECPEPEASTTTTTFQATTTTMLP